MQVLPDHGNRATDFLIQVLPEKARSIKENWQRQHGNTCIKIKKFREEQGVFSRLTRLNHMLHTHITHTRIYARKEARKWIDRI